MNAKVSRISLRIFSSLFKSYLLMGLRPSSPSLSGSPTTPVFLDYFFEFVSRKGFDDALWGIGFDFVFVSVLKQTSSLSPRISPDSQEQFGYAA